MEARHPREVHPVMSVGLVDFGKRYTTRTIQLGEELEPWDCRVWRICGGIWIHDPSYHRAQPEAPIQVAPRRFVHLYIAVNIRATRRTFS